MGNTEVELKDQVRICQHCRQPFAPKRQTDKYCQLSCRLDDYHEQAMLYHKTCLFCGKPFEAKIITSRFCSIKCQYAYRNAERNRKVPRDYWMELKEYILERDNFTCQDCGHFSMPTGLDVHHIKSISKGGKNTPENCITLCHKCHLKCHLKRHNLIKDKNAKEEHQN